MKLKYMWLAWISLCMASCSEEEMIKSGESQREVLVTSSASTQSRIVLSDQGTHYDALWHKDDQISLFTATQSDLVYGTSLEENSANAAFTPVDEALECREGNTVYACYPDATKHSEEGMVVNLPATNVMDYHDGNLRSFAYAVGTISDGSVNFQFKHISAFIALEVKPEMLTDATKGINRVTVSTSASEPLSIGEGDTFDFSTQTANTTHGTNSVQLNVNNHVVDSLWTVYIPILPQPGGADITITLADSIGQTLYTQTKQTPDSGFLAGCAYHQKAVEVAEVAYLVDGQTFNARIKQLANGNSNLSYQSADNLIKRIEFVNESTTIPTNHMVVSTEASPAPIYASFNPTDGLLTISTAAKRMEIVNASYMFFYCSTLSSLDLSNFNTSNVTNMKYIFGRCYYLSSLDLSSFDTSAVTNMWGMFDYCSSLSNLDLSGFDTSNVTDMKYMFNYCSSLSSLDLSGFDTSNVTDMAVMFQGCSFLSSLNLSGFNTSNVTDMSAMFNFCSSLSSLDLSSFDTSNVTDMGLMFQDCSSLSSLNLSGFNTSNVTDMHGMFKDCASTSQTCRVTTTQETKEFLLNNTGTTNMKPARFIWEEVTNNVTETFSIVGTWEMTEGDMDEWTIIFREDGTGRDSWVDEGNQDEYEFTYSLDWENRKLYTQVPGEESMTWEIVAYSDTEVTLRYSFDGGTAEYVFQKVS